MPEWHAGDVLAKCKSAATIADIFKIDFSDASMGARYFRYTFNGKGMVILAGLSPDETFEFEHLLNQDDRHRSAADWTRLDALCEKHCRAAKQHVMAS